VERWHHKDGQCLPFTWGGCGGNDNNFVSKAKCETYCKVEQESDSECEDCQQEKKSSSDVCFMPKEVGMCRAYFPRFFYDANAQKCEEFIYGGCGGNENNFETLDECETECQGAQLIHD